MSLAPISGAAAAFALTRPARAEDALGTTRRRASELWAQRAREDDAVRSGAGGVPAGSGLRRTRDAAATKAAAAAAAAAVERAAQPAQRTVAGFHFENECNVDGEVLVGQAECHLTYWGFEVAAAVLYTPPGQRAATGAAVMDASLPKRLHLQYLRGVSGDDFRKSTMACVVANGLLSPAVEEGLASWNALFEDVKHGDAYTLNYEPSGGSGRGSLALCLNGKELGRVEGRELSAAIFSVWFGEEPFMAKLKRDLLAV